MQNPYTLPEEPVEYRAPGVAVAAREDTSEIIHFEMVKDVAGAAWDAWVVGRASRCVANVRSTD